MGMKKMSRSSRRRKRQTLEVIVTLKEMEKRKWPKISAYVYRRRRLLAKESLEQDEEEPSTGRAKFSLDPVKQHLIVMIGPEVEDSTELKRHKPSVHEVLVDPGKPSVIQIELDRVVWWCWLRVPYIVTGTVKKKDEDHTMPICIGEVDIYDVDIGRCILRIPDPIIERIRDGIIDILVEPPPIDLPEPPWPDCFDDWCGTGPRPPFPPRPNDVRKRLETLPPKWKFAGRRFDALPTAKERMDRNLKAMSMVERRSFLNTEAVETVKVSKLLYSNTAQFRNLLVKEFLAFRYWLCWYPWIYWLWWPWCWYSLEKLGTAKLRSDGSFTEIVWLSICRRDVPDLWFVVRQKMEGVERVIYARHPVPCNTYWNHPSGKQVHLVVTDPSAVGCHEDPETDLDPAGLWVVPLAIGNYSLKRIYGTGAGSLPADAAKIGLYESISTGLGAPLNVFYDGPFGGMLGLRLLFSDALEGAGVKYYRIKYRLNGSGGWTPLSDRVVRHYSDYDPILDILTFPSYLIGPKPVGTEWLYEIPPRDPPNIATDPFAKWVVINAKVDLMNGFYNSSGYGYVEFKIELFDAAGIRVDPSAAGITFKLPATDDIWTTITTTDTAFNPALVGPDPEAPAFQAFIFRLQIDNRQPTAVIDEPEVSPSGNKTHPVCGMLRYEPTDEEVKMPYQARHPRRFAMYRFRLYRSNTHLHTEAGLAGDMGPSGSFVLTANLMPDPLDPSKLDLLGECPEAAFSENLYLWNMAYNGWHRVGPDNSDVRAFALAPSIP